MLEWELSRKAKRSKTIKDAQQAKFIEEKKNKSLIEKLSQIEQDLNDSKETSAKSKTQIEFLSTKVTRQDKLIKRVIVLLIISILLILIALFGFYFYESLSIVGKIFNWVLSAGAFFSLGNLILNGIKFFRKN